jgi:hypothetical protein
MVKRHLTHNNYDEPEQFDCYDDNGDLIVVSDQDMVNAFTDETNRLMDLGFSREEAEREAAIKLCDPEEWK